MDHLSASHRPRIEQFLHQLGVALVVALADAHKILDPVCVAAEKSCRVAPNPISAPVVMLVARVVGDQLGSPAEFVLAGLAVPGQRRYEAAPLVVKPALEFGDLLLG